MVDCYLYCDCVLKRYCKFPDFYLIMIYMLDFQSVSKNRSPTTVATEVEQVQCFTSMATPCIAL